MKTGVIYDFGCHKGGGDYVMLNILEALSKAGYDLDLLTSKPTGVREAAKLFGKDAQIEGLKVMSFKIPSFLRHPYSLAYIAKEVTKRYELFLVADDVPKYLTGKVISYVHYPHAARITLNSLVEKRYKRSFEGGVMWSMHKALLPRFFYTHHIPNNVVILANSTLTREHVLHALKPELIFVVYPPVASAQIHELFKESKVNKEDTAVLVGKLTPEKGIDDIIRVARLVKRRLKLRFKIIGFSNDKTYMNSLLAVIKYYGVEDVVELLPNVGRETVISQLIKAKFIIHSALYEPFGISVVEGMAAACVPIVKKGFNGPWIDITMKGKYGLGFENVHDLANVLDKAVSRYEFKLENIVSRALEFDEKSFKANFLRTIKPFLP